MDPTPQHLVPSTRITAALLLALVTLLTVAGTASAHGVEGELTLTKVEQVGPRTVRVEVGIVYDGDKEPATDAAVEVTLTDVEGGAVGPVDMARVDEDSSLYAADVDVTGPGNWSIDVSSTDPAGAASTVFDVVDGAGSEPGNVTTLAPESTVAPSIAPEASGDQVMTANGTDPSGNAASEDQGASEKSNGAAVIVLAVAAFVLLGGAAVVVYLRRGEDATSDVSDPGPDADAADEADAAHDESPR